MCEDARDGEVAPDVRDGVVQAEGRGVDAGLARPAARGVSRAGRRCMAQAPARRPPGPPVLRRPARAQQEMVIGSVKAQLFSHMHDLLVHCNQEHINVICASSSSSLILLILKVAFSETNRDLKVFIQSFFQCFFVPVKFSGQNVAENV